jgi:Bifunctional DNA primase/polymerase, N-terminal
MSARNEMLRAAFGYIARGWPPFVLSSSKVPVANCEPCTAEHITPEQMEACACLCCHGFYGATLDRSRLAEMVRRHPRGLLAIRTGAPSGTAVVDVDQAGIPLMREMVVNKNLPRTVTAISGGGGYHLIYAHPGGKIMSGAKKIAPGIDSKADGAYIVVAPSVHPRTREPYRWLGSFTGDLTPMPPALADLLHEPSSPAGGWSWARIPPGGARGSHYAEAALRGELERLLALAGTEGERNDTLAKKAAFSLGHLVATGALDKERTACLLERAALQIGLKPGEVRRAINSGFRAGALRPRGGRA